MIDSTQINLPQVVAEVEMAFQAYEAALMSNDLAGLDALFWEDDRTVRYGSHENLYGIAAIRAFRVQRPTTNLARRVTRVTMTTYGHDFATVDIEFSRHDERGRQSQTWVRMARGWQVVAAHISLLPNVDPSR
ncbi:MAG: oxalurate catabolism protein HpxZ [Rhodocyclaceae bacterium]|nr:oxalurate catabolism protein HpxZ [Rhodocyclaceae bacterium]